VLKQHPCGILFHANVGTCAPPSDEPSPERERFIQLLLSDPAEARRERLKERAEYWRRRLQALRERAELLRALLGQPALEAGTTPLDRWRARVELAVAEGDVLEAGWRLHQLEQALGERSEPLPAVPTPAPLIAPAEPRKPGRKVICTCGECARCKAREAMRRLRAERRAKAARKARKARGAGGFTTPHGSVLPPRA
jgi:hypothetical protein